MGPQGKERVGSDNVATRGNATARKGRSVKLEVDRVAAALRQLYGRIADEPLPRRLVELVTRLKTRH
jgi:hypothetical protein